MVGDEIESIQVQFLAAGTFHDLCVDYSTLLHYPESDPFTYRVLQNATTFFD
jgi:hypothetical protein